MNKLLHRFILLCLLTAISGIVFAADIPNNTIYYTTEDDNIIEPYYYGFESKYGTTYILSNTYENGQGVIIFDRDLERIGESAFSGCSKLTSIDIPNSVTSIGNSAFQNCSGLLRINIPDNVTSIGDYAFSSCHNLTIVDIPYSVTSIGDDAFYDCYNLFYIDLPNSVKNIGYHAFWGCSRLTSIYIPNSITNIGYGAFANCPEIASIKVDAENTKYDSRNNCNAIINTSTNELIAGCKNTSFPNNIEGIGASTFLNCYGLTNITIPKSVTSIGEAAFAGCIGVTTMKVAPDNIAYDSRNDCNAIVKSSTNELIAGCKNTIIPNTVTSIGQSAFCYCTELTSITIPKSVKSIYLMAFYGCTGLKDIKFSNGLKLIDLNAFANCSSLTNITLPNSLTEMYSGPFSNCPLLSNITCLASTPPTLYGNFGTYGTLHVLPGCKSAYENAEYWKNFTIVEDVVDKRTITISTNEYTTYCSDVNLDFSNVEGIKAYIAISYSPNTRTLTIANVNNVPAGEGMLLKGEAGKIYKVPATNEASVMQNLLKGSTSAFTLYPTDGDYINFVLTKNSAGKMGFYSFNGSVSMPANKAWLQIPTYAFGANANNVKGFSLVEEDGVLTGISDVKEESSESNVIFDLQGRRINDKPTHGLYISNGKKVMVK